MSSEGTIVRMNTRLMTGAAALLIVLSGCTKKPGGQVVAVVNNEEVTQQELNAELQNARVPQGIDQKKVMPALLQRVVDRKLITQLAKTDGLDKTPAYLAQLRITQENLLANQYIGKIARTISLPDPAAVDAFIASNPTIFSQRKRYTLNQIVFPQISDQAIVRSLQPVHTLDAIAAILSAAHIQFVRGVGKLDSAVLPPRISAQIAALPPGEPFLLPDGGRIVASVIQSEEPIPVAPDQAKPTAVKMLRQKALSDALQKKLAAAKSSATISYAPGLAPPPSPTPTPSPAAQ
jgi:EpsD family peptidyl-prolyl cis-trans isomerase